MSEKIWINEFTRRVIELQTANIIGLLRSLHEVERQQEKLRRKLYMVTFGQRKLLRRLSVADARQKRLLASLERCAQQTVSIRQERALRRQQEVGRAFFGYGATQSRITKEKNGSAA